MNVTGDQRRRRTCGRRVQLSQSHHAELPEIPEVLKIGLLARAPRRGLFLVEFA